VPFVYGVICSFPSLCVVYLAGQREDRHGEGNISLLIFFLKNKALKLIKTVHIMLQNPSSN